MRRSLAALLLLAASCGSSPVSPDSPASTPVVTLPTCAAWAAQQTGAGLAAATGDVVAQRATLLAAGGGLRSVSSKYYAMYFPSSWASQSTRRVMVDLHGTGGAPETEWSVDWQTIIPSRNWAWIGLKYVSATGVHDDETTIYANIKTMLTEIAASCEFGTPSIFLEGFSRGSAESFPIAYLDLKDRRYFKAIGNNSGAWIIGDPLTTTMQAIVDRGETSAYVGSKFWMYCGGLDNGHGYPMCDEMKNARSFIQSYGGTVERLYEDPTGGHGGLAKNTDAWSALFTYWESLK